MGDWHDVGAADDFNDGEAVAVLAGGQAVAVFRLDDELYALKDLCTHGNARLSDGYVEDGCVECPLHQGLFDIRSGAARCAPVTEAVRSFPVRVVAGRVEVGCAAAAAAAPVAPAFGQWNAVLDSVERAAPDVALLRLRGGPLPPYRAGQYLDILLADGQRRSYSMATPAGADTLELHVRHLPGGLFTDRLFGVAGAPGTPSAGDSLTLEGPFGDFYLRDGDAPVILLASGTGFAPVKALVEQAIAGGLARPMRLYWGGRRAQDLYLDALCRSWAASLPWFDYVPVLSEAAPEQGWSGRGGYVHLAVIDDHPDLSRHQVYACGAPPMVEAARAAFSQQCALPAGQFFADAFLSKADQRR